MSKNSGSTDNQDVGRRTKLSSKEPDPLGAIKAPLEPEKAKQSLRNSFLFTLIIGATLILFPMKSLPYEGMAKIGIAIVLMLIYLRFGIKYLQSPNTRAVFADSLYYLGFLFTFIALVGAMIFLNELNFQSIIGQMGPALVTTVLGMAARIYLTQFEPITTEPETETINLISNLSSQVTVLLQNLERAQRESTRRIEEFSKSLNDIDLSKLRQAFDSLSESISQLNRSSDQLSTFSESTKNSFVKAQQKISELDSVVTNAREKLDQIDFPTDDIKGLTENIKNAAVDFEEVGEKTVNAFKEVGRKTTDAFVEAGQKTTDAFEKSSNRTKDTFEEASRRVETKISRSASEATNAIADVTREVEAARGEASNLSKVLTKTVIEVVEFLNRKS